MRVFVPSRNRWANVPTMQALAGHANLVWLVPADQAAAYAEAGATTIVTGPPGKSAKVNDALDRFNDEWCVFTDDDVTHLSWLTAPSKTRPTTLGEAAEEYVRVGEAMRAPLVVIPCIRNAMFLKPTVSGWTRSVDWFFAVAPHTKCRYDESLAYFGDTEFAAQCFDRYGRIARPNYIMGDYRINDASSQYSADDRGPAAEVILRRYPHLFKRAKGNPVNGPLDLRRVPG